MPGRGSSAARILEGQGGLRVHLREARVSSSIRGSDAEVHDQGDSRDPLIIALDSARKLKGLSMAELSRECGMKRQQMSRILGGGTASPGLKTLRTICFALDLDLALIIK